MSEFKYHLPENPEKRDLTFCTHCNDRSIFLVEWEEHGEEDWRLVLRCGNCEAFEEVICDQDTVEYFDEKLDQQVLLITKEFKRMCKENMSEDVDRLVGAINAGAILPEDFNLKT